MKVTNELNLPEFLFNIASQSAGANPDVFRATTLLKSRKEAELSRRHDSEITIDCADMGFALFGTMAHESAEKHTEKSDNILTEHRMFLEMDGNTFTGQCDYFDKDTGWIRDYKTTTVWKFINNDFDDWKRQLLMYAVLLESEGYHVSGGEIFGIMRDWQSSKAHESNYPTHQWGEVTFIFSDKEKAEMREWIRNEMAARVALRNVADDDLPECTPKERWYKGEKYAVMKKGNLRAKKLCDTEDEAKSYIGADKSLYIEKRTGTDGKCPRYCKCKGFCKYAQEKGYNDEIL